jgi:hypothetical protein
MALTVQQERVLEAWRKANYYEVPPNAMSGIGQNQSALAPSNFGGLAHTGAPAADQPLGTTPVKLVGFSTIVPLVADVMNPEGMIPTPINDQVIMAHEGMYLINSFVNATVDSGVVYHIEVYVNGIATGIFSEQDLSQQTTQLGLQLSSPLYANEGDLVELWGKADIAASTFIMDLSLFFLTRIR